MHRVEKTLHHRERPDLGHLLIEAGMIVFSILLALGIESWRENRAHTELAATALHDIRAEIARNRDELRRVLPEHRELERYLQGLEERVERGENVEITTTYRPANLLTAAWDTATATQATVYIDFAEVQLVSRLYSGHRWVTRLEQSWLELSLNPSFKTRENLPMYVSSLKQTISDLAGVEAELAAGCDSVLEKIGPGRD